MAATSSRRAASSRGRRATHVQVDFSGLYVDVDNGYDAWAIDNGFTTYSDDPGRDAQRSAAGSVRVQAELDGVDLVSITGFAETDAVFSFDADWGNAGVLGAVRLRLGDDERSRAAHGEPRAARAVEARRDRGWPRRLARRRVRARSRRRQRSAQRRRLRRSVLRPRVLARREHRGRSDYDATNFARVRSGCARPHRSSRSSRPGCAGSGAAPTTRDSNAQCVLARRRHARRRARVRLAARRAALRISAPRARLQSRRFQRLARRRRLRRVDNVALSPAQHRVRRRSR